MFAERGCTVSNHHAVLSAFSPLTDRSRGWSASIRRDLCDQLVHLKTFRCLSKLLLLLPKWLLGTLQRLTQTGHYGEMQTFWNRKGKWNKKTIRRVTQEREQEMKKIKMKEIITKASQKESSWRKRKNIHKVKPQIELSRRDREQVRTNENSWKNHKCLHENSLKEESIPLVLSTYINKLPA